MRIALGNGVVGTTLQVTVGDCPLPHLELRRAQAKNQKQNWQYTLCFLKMMFNLGRDDFFKIPFHINFVLYELADGA